MSKFTITLAVFGLCTVVAPADSSNSVTPGATATASTKAIGPAPAHSHQSKVLESALSADTRKTLFEAMNSVPDNDTKKPGASK